MEQRKRRRKQRLRGWMSGTAAAVSHCQPANEAEKTKWWQQETVGRST